MQDDVDYAATGLAQIDPVDLNANEEEGAAQAEPEADPEAGF